MASPQTLKTSSSAAECHRLSSLAIPYNDSLLHAIIMSGAEILGATASIIAIVQISKTIITICQFYIGEVDGASQDLRVILIEVSTLKGIAKSLKYLTQPNVANSTLLEQLAAVTGPIEGCKKALEELEKLLPDTAISANTQNSKRRKLDAAAAALAWPLRKGKAKKLLQEIMQHKTTINLALTADFMYASICLIQ